MKIREFTFYASILLIILSISVAIPLTIKTVDEGGGAWGFGVIGLPLLLPLSGYILFGFAGIFRREIAQRKIFLTAHMATLVTGFVSFSILPIYPAVFALIPFMLFVASAVDRKHLKYYLLIMVVLSITANLLLLKWELDFHRTLPLLQLF